MFFIFFRLDLAMNINYLFIPLIFQNQIEIANRIALYFFYKKN